MLCEINVILPAFTESKHISATHQVQIGALEYARVLYVSFKFTFHVVSSP